jgi:hypothetical protein
MLPPDPSTGKLKPGMCEFGPAINIVGVNLIAKEVSGCMQLPPWVAAIWEIAQPTPA